MHKWKLPPSQIPLLKKPLGELIEGPPDIVWKKILEEKILEKAKKITTVGDVVSFNFIKYTKQIPDLIILDGRSLRHKIKNPHYQKFIKYMQANVNLILYAENPRGTITKVTVDSIKLAYSDGKSILFINGEEDLCTIPAVLYSPLGSLVFYGQPRQGVVVIFVDETQKLKFKKIFESMEEVKDGN